MSEDDTTGAMGTGEYENLEGEHPLTYDLQVYPVGEHMGTILVGNSGLLVTAEKQPDSSFRWTYHYVPDGHTTAPTSPAETIKQTMVFAGAMASLLEAKDNFPSNFGAPAPSEIHGTTNDTMAESIKRIMGDQVQVSETTGVQKGQKDIVIKMSDLDTREVMSLSRLKERSLKANYQMKVVR